MSTPSDKNIPPKLLLAVRELVEGETDANVGDFSIGAVTSFRGDSRVWRVSGPIDDQFWYVKRHTSAETMRRHIRVVEILQRAADLGSAIEPVSLAGVDEEGRLVATNGLEGELASDTVVRGTRYDKLFSWPRVSLTSLARTVGAAIRQVWGASDGDDLGLEDHTCEGVAERIERKCFRLREPANPIWRQVEEGVSRCADRLARMNGTRALLIGDTDFSNLLICDGRVAFFDLDDVGIGDPVRDVGWMLYRLGEIRENPKYQTHRISRFSRSLLEATNYKANDPRFKLYEVEYHLDALWSAIRRSVDLDLPVHGHSVAEIQTRLITLIASQEGA